MSLCMICAKELTSGDNGLLCSVCESMKMRQEREKQIPVVGRVYPLSMAAEFPLKAKDGEVTPLLSPEVCRDIIAEWQKLRSSGYMPRKQCQLEKTALACMEYIEKLAKEGV